MNPFIRKMTIQRGKHGLGFILSSQSPCVVSSVNQNGPSDKAGLKTGDEIIEVNGVDVSEFKHDDVVKQILLYDSPYVEVKVKTCIKPTQQQTHNTTRRSSLFDSLNRVVKGVRRTSLVLGSPILRKSSLGTSNFSLSDDNCVCTEPSVESSDNINYNSYGKKVDRLCQRRLVEEDLEDKVFCDTPETNQSTTPEMDKQTLLEMSMNPQPLNLSNLFGVSPRKQSLNNNDDFVYKAVVYYQCTVDIPNNANNLRTTGYSMLKNSVHKIHKNPKSSRSMVLLTLSSLGVRLSNPLGKEIITYPLQTLVFSAICSDYPNYFGLITKKVLSDHSSALSSSFTSSPGTPQGRNVVLCSCHVFMVDLNLVCHDAHIGTAALFDLSCKKSTEFDGCISFPSTASYILKQVNLLFEESQIAAHDSSASSSNNSSYQQSTPEPESPDKLMRSPPTSLTPMNRREKQEILKEIQQPIFYDEESSKSHQGASESFGSTGKPSDASPQLQHKNSEKLMVADKLPSDDSSSRSSTLKHSHTVPSIPIKQQKEDPIIPFEGNELKDEKKEQPIDLIRKPRSFTNEWTGRTDERWRFIPDEFYKNLMALQLHLCYLTTLTYISGKKVLHKTLTSKIRTKRRQSFGVSRELCHDKLRGSENNGFGRRKSAPDPDACAQVSRNIKNGPFNSRNLLTNSLRMEHRKPPLHHNRSTATTTTTANKPTTLFNGLKRTFRRKSEGIALSPHNSVKEFLHRNFNKKQETPQSLSRHEPRKDTNENVKRLSLSSASSELSLNDASRVEGWARSFERLLSDVVGVKCFQEFLKKEFSEENVLFWIACERFKLMNTDVEKMKLNANEIYRSYLSPQAAFLVNVNQTAVKKVEENLETPNSDMFSIPQDQVFQLMKFDSYNRFLKSELYRECLLAENEDRLFPYEDEIDEELRKRHAWVKKPKSNLNTDKRGNLLNFLTKGRATKTPEPENKNRKENRSASVGTLEEINRKNGLLTNNSNEQLSKDSQLWDGSESKSKSSFIRVVLPDGHSTMVVVQSGVSIKQALSEICEEKKINLQTCDVTVGYDKQIASLDNDLTTLSDNVVFLEKRVLFRFDLPNGRSVGIKANPSKTLQDVLQPVMKKNGFNIENYSVHVMNNKVCISLDTSISNVENKRIITKLSHKKIEKQNSDSVVGRHQDFRSSFRRFRTNSFKDDKNGRGADRRGSLDRLERERLTREDTLGRKIGNEVKHLLLGRTKSADDDGAHALMTVLQKSQSGRLDDQRGGSIPRDLELPDFLKVTVNTPLTPRSSSVNTSAQFSISTQSSPARSYPATPIIIDRLPEFKRGSEESLDRSLSLNSSLNSARPSLCSVRSWKELSSPDRELIDKSFMSGESINTSQSHDTIRSNGTLLEISRSDPALVSNHTKQTICNANSAPPFANLTDLKDINFSLFPHQEYTSTPKASTITVADRDRSRSLERYDNIPPTHSNALPLRRPQPINTFNESDILRGLEISDFEVVHIDDDITLISTPETPSGSIEPKSPLTPSGLVIPETNMCTPTNSLCNGTTKSQSKSFKCSPKASPKLSQRTKLLTELNSEPDLKNSDSNKKKLNNTTERIGSVDLVDYELSPKASRYNGNPFENKNITNVLQETVFESNAIPTPEKDNLLNGETIRGRQNEKITFV